MPDYIDRDEAMKVVGKASWAGFRLAGLPAADVVERKKGKWIYDCERMAGDGLTYRQYHCTVCSYQSITSHFKFCPNCGCVMEDDND